LFDRPIFFRDPYGGAAAQHVVDLVLEVRSLAVGRSLRPDRQADAQLVGGKEVDIAMAFGVTRLGIELGNLVRFHRHVVRR